MGQITIHMIIVNNSDLRTATAKEELDDNFEPFYAFKSEEGHVFSP
jgi:hypothetical protein